LTDKSAFIRLWRKASEPALQREREWLRPKDGDHRVLSIPVAEPLVRWVSSEKSGKSGEKGKGVELSEFG
jgi:hypothetical protein